MASLEPTPPKVSAHDLLAFNDAELVQYMMQNRGPDDRFVLRPAGWTRLPKDQRERLAERLKFGAQKAADAARSCPVELGQVTARLLEATRTTDNTSHQRESTPERHVRRRTETPPGKDEYREVEIGDYYALVNDGGRPCYAIALLEEVSENPKDYRELLRPFQYYPDTDRPEWRVFGLQLSRWQDFRVWQLTNRNMYEPDSDYLAYVEEQKRFSAATRLELKDVAALEADPSHLRPDWRRREDRRRRDYLNLWRLEEPKPAGAEERDTEDPVAPDADGHFRVYVERVKRRLALHGFTRPFELDEDPKRQDKLTTWIEYVNYEYAWHDRYTRRVKQMQPEHDEDWTRLAESGVLRPRETEEYLLTDKSAWERQREYTAASNAHEAAKAALEKAENERSDLSIPEREQRLAAAQSELAAAQEAWDVFNRRNRLINFLRGTEGKPGLDQVWKRVVDSGVLRPGETQELIFTKEFGARHWEEGGVIFGPVMAAEKAVRAAENLLNQRSNLGVPERERRLARARSTMAAVGKSWEVAKRRHDLIRGFIAETMEYRRAEHDLYVQQVLLQWVLEQVSLIEAESSNESPVAGPGVADAHPAAKRSAKTTTPSTRPAANDASHKTRSGRVTKKAAPQRRGGRRVAGSRGDAALPPGRRRCSSLPATLDPRHGAISKACDGSASDVEM
ncbi:hypothetical protein MAPG_10764 [Magnaporthiopsis poae ATCC 64411]|uniref:Uncharacterized protein n=1 Tax=Magnaporthiopsis poae (strain ATCC 64411 / 73-15) TaxID=644358 RepID=A0A0C4EDG5_MAGP6|nr:hypothetical protein MAPG_10764 [Magnaporthiopsis poae ATCC 64411]